MSEWTVNAGGYDPDAAAFRASLFTLSNTRMGLRGAEDEGAAEANPGLYIAGLFDRSEALAPEIVTFPDPLTLRLACGDTRFGPHTCTVHDYRRELDMRGGLLRRSCILKSPDGVRVALESRRFLSFDDPRAAAAELTFTFENYSGPVRVETVFDAYLPSREGGYRYDEQIRHFNLVGFNDPYEEDFHARLALRDRGTHVEFATFLGAETPVLRRERKIFCEKVAESVELDVTAGRPATVVKYAVVDDARRKDPELLAEDADLVLARMKHAGFDGELARSASALGQKWASADVTIEGDEDAQRLIRYNIFQLLGLGAEDRDDFSIGAKGLSTEHYGGHYFWDTEIFLLPFYLNTAPAVARNILSFRARTLDAACRRAREQGFEGCLWPWQSDELGNEGIRQIVTDDGRALRRDILDQRHIVSDVAWACFRYAEQTGDEAFLRTRLMPLIVESLRFWKSFLSRRQGPDAGAYHIRNVMGPDEYHTGVDDNFHTNFLTKRVFERFFSWWDGAPPKHRDEVRDASGLGDDELDTFRDIASGLHVPRAKDGVIEQFAGYFNLEDLPLKEYSEAGLPRYPDPSVGRGLPDAERQDALQAHATRTRLIKQADAILPMLLEPDAFDGDTVRATFDYYDLRTLQFSSLSPGVCAAVAVRAGRLKRAKALFRLGAAMDLEDIKEETAGGLHTACHGGAYSGVVQGFAGARVTPDGLQIDPRLPEGWKAVAFTLRVRGAEIVVRCAPEEVRVRVRRSPGLRLSSGGVTEWIEGDGEYRFERKPENTS
ncbi:glycoside hydrolase family 65 protein [Kiritimatiella glycovorans]|uniref:Kojibiose phosphorylase n=1 Tax=Kiritimatiella glycovorans TaxID=1307763 RepID=A0A0G3EIG3_9BACT|nr:glycosyl hydrolase family 65 protein [Kiritimatiella glycovorans]AKJ64605.1 Kojibiose phosphorylase [Kiritimatiella glycovorans]